LGDVVILPVLKEKSGARDEKGTNSSLISGERVRKGRKS
jgi:hypothetical protein